MENARELHHLYGLSGSNIHHIITWKRGFEERIRNYSSYYCRRIPVIKVYDASRRLLLLLLSILITNQNCKSFGIQPTYTQD